MTKHTGIMKYIYIEYTDHKEFVGSTDREMVYAENFARSIFVNRKNNGENVHNWTVRNDERVVIACGATC